MLLSFATGVLGVVDKFLNLLDPKTKKIAFDLYLEKRKVRALDLAEQYILLSKEIQVLAKDAITTSAKKNLILSKIKSLSVLEKQFFSVN